MFVILEIHKFALPFDSRIPISNLNSQCPNSKRQLTIYREGPLLFFFDNECPRLLDKGKHCNALLLCATLIGDPH